MKEKKSICLTFELVSNDKTAFGSFAFTILIELIKRRFIKKDHSKKQINRNFTLFCSLAAFNIINLSESIKHLINFDCVLDDRVRIFLLLLHKFEIRVNQSNTSQRYTIRAEIEIDLFYLAIFFSNSHSLRLFSVVAHVSISLSLSRSISWIPCTLNVAVCCQERLFIVEIITFAIILCQSCL